MSDILGKSNHEDQFNEDYFLKVGTSSQVEKFREEYNLITKLSPLKPYDKVLEVGCGNGRVGLYLLSQEKTLDMTFSDVTPVAKKYLSDYNFVECSMTKTPFPDNNFDKVYCSQVLNHIEDGERAIKEMYRILKPGGSFLIMTQNPYCVFIYKLGSFFKLTPKFEYDKTVKRIYSIHTLSNLLNKHGFKIQDVKYYSDFISPKLRLNFLRRRFLMIASK